jgi:hypothetical protein
VIIVESFAQAGYIALIQTNRLRAADELLAKWTAAYREVRRRRFACATRRQ